MVRRKAIAWTRRRLFKRKELERDLTAEEFAQKMNALFSKYDVFASPLPAQAGARAPKQDVEVVPVCRPKKRCGSCGVVGHNRRGYKRYWVHMSR